MSIYRAIRPSKGKAQPTVVFIRAENEGRAVQTLDQYIGQGSHLWFTMEMISESQVPDCRTVMEWRETSLTKMEDES